MRSRPATRRDAVRDPSAGREGLLAGVRDSRDLLVLTGAGISTASGIPDYRDADGAWKRPPPVAYLDFVRWPSVRRRYWARSYLGWPRLEAARPSAAHLALARLEEVGRVRHVITQNVDGLHQRAGSRRVLDLHGRLDRVVCLTCRAPWGRALLQAALEEANPTFANDRAQTLPDGDVDLDGVDLDAFRVVGCPRCGGVLKPDVVFFGENVPRERVATAYGHVGACDALLVIGSSLTVFSGYRFVRAARERGVPVWIVSLGRTRGDPDATVKVEAPADEVLADLLAAQGLPAGPAP